jgi:hypothetical protein
VRRLVPLVLSIALGMLLGPPSAPAAEAGWHSEQPVAAGIGVPVGLGRIGGMAFWSPDKGVLVTAGTAGTPAGVYAYDGSGWYLYSTVCGGHEGGIAISGPDEFWTISNYAEPQEGILGELNKETDRTLCHFAGGKVVKSYAEPASSPNVFSQMHAAACAGPADCWFAGNALSENAANHDPFHLHWDGNVLTQVPSSTVLEPEIAPMAGNADGLAFARGALFEAASEAPYLREVSLGDPSRFRTVEPLDATPGPFVLSTEPFQQELWAGSKAGAVLHLGAAGFETLPTEAPIFEQENLLSGPIGAIGAEPGTEDAWLGGGDFSTDAEVRRIDAEGTLGPILHLPQAGEELSAKGRAEHIVCPATNQCWMATSKGWLFHLGGPPPEGVNTDPLMHLLITSRPEDNSSRKFVPPGLPQDDSGEIEPDKPSSEGPPAHFPVPHPPKSIVYDVHQKLVGKRVLELTFKLRARAHVQLKAKFHRKVVAKTERLTFGKGAHRLYLKLDPKRWPTGLDFPVTAAKKRSSK